MEIERKFLIKKMPDLTNVQAIDIEQGYLSFFPEVRTRKKDEKFYLTVKSDGDIAREEYEIEISQNTYEELSDKVAGLVLKKRRYEIPLNKVDVAELDIYENFEDLKVVEVEFIDIDSANNFEVPCWFGTEVTRDKEFRNKTLAQIISNV
ncbi:CYTH domain-containing protein [Clostridium sp. CS001]|uniref:CYTH domain-containing protein n=1 Tax=Clostridium sp. CS001 TaxID=2880648 RepID=UPI001CF5F119|nr:CYTH domain-containing protein [Clostridium sp. CS001]MCB2290526.1 CYTH domain-containing protein [Clostridium sp. CS001]